MFPSKFDRKKFLTMDLNAKFPNIITRYGSYY